LIVVNFTAPKFVCEWILGENGRGLEEQVLDLLAQGDVLTRTRLRDALAVNNERLGKALERAGRVGRTPRGWQRLR
jgi:hypothetical protein